LGTAASRAWRLANPEKARANSHKRKARALNNGGTWTAAEWTALKAEHGNRCVACHKTEQELEALGRTLVPDHVQALATDGYNNISNLQPLCHGIGGCNNSKGAKHIDYRSGVGIPYDTLEMSKVVIQIPME
jgi:hypothetical protein